jgi:hypothetical protein
MPSIPEDELKQKLLDEGFVPRAIQGDDGDMYTIPEENREQFADRIVGLFRQYAAKERSNAEEEFVKWHNARVDTFSISAELLFEYQQEQERIKQLKEEAQDVSSK